MAPQLPTHAQIVIIGGGIIGCSLAYHLTKLGRKDVLLLERKKLTSGTTWHAAGLVRAMLYTANLTKLAKYTVDLYKTLERETGQATGYKQNGSLSIATNEERWDELRRGASMARAFGVPAEPVTPKRVQELWPLMNTADVIGAIHFPEDGSTNPADTTMAFAKGARAGGARLIEDCKVTGVPRTAAPSASDGPATSARDRRELRGPVGPRGRQDGRRRRAAHACEHFYIVTSP
jgi:4-methylaminobutanoate oxidase (formaldehyde-forming)